MHTHVVSRLGGAGGLKCDLAPEPDLFDTRVDALLPTDSFSRGSLTNLQKPLRANTLLPKFAPLRIT